MRSFRSLAGMVVLAGTMLVADACDDAPTPALPTTPVPPVGAAPTSDFPEDEAVSWPARLELTVALGE